MSEVLISQWNDLGWYKWYMVGEKFAGTRRGMCFGWDTGSRMILQPYCG